MIEESAQQTNQQDGEIFENRPKNMKNTIIRKLTSMMGISRENLHEVEEEANIENSNLDDKRTKRHSSYCLSNNPYPPQEEDKLHKNR